MGQRDRPDARARVRCRSRRRRRDRARHAANERQRRPCTVRGDDGSSDRADEIARQQKKDAKSEARERERRKKIGAALARVARLREEAQLPKHRNQHDAELLWRKIGADLVQVARWRDDATRATAGLGEADDVVFLRDRKTGAERIEIRSRKPAPGAAATSSLSSSPPSSAAASTRPTKTLAPPTSPPSARPTRPGARSVRVSVETKSAHPVDSVVARPREKYVHQEEEDDDDDDGDGDGKSAGDEKRSSEKIATRPPSVEPSGRGRRREERSGGELRRNENGTAQNGAAANGGTTPNVTVPDTVARRRRRRRREKIVARQWLEVACRNAADTWLVLLRFTASLGCVEFAALAKLVDSLAAMLRCGLSAPVSEVSTAAAAAAATRANKSGGGGGEKRRHGGGDDDDDRNESFAIAQKEDTATVVLRCVMLLVNRCAQYDAAKRRDENPTERDDDSDSDGAEDPSMRVDREQLERLAPRSDSHLRLRVVERFVRRHRLADVCLEIWRRRERRRERLQRTDAHYNAVESGDRVFHKLVISLLWDAGSSHVALGLTRIVTRRRAPTGDFLCRFLSDPRLTMELQRENRGASDDSGETKRAPQPDGDANNEDDDDDISYGDETSRRECGCGAAYRDSALHVDHWDPPDADEAFKHAKWRCAS